MTLGATPSFPHIIDYVTESENRELSLLLSGDTVRVSVAGVSYGFSGTYTELRDGDVHSIGVTRDSGGVLKLYIDGEYKTQLTGVTTAISAGGTLVIGQDQDSVGGSFSTLQYTEGTVYDIRIFGDVRSDAEMAASYRSDLPNDESDLIANWKFDQLSTDGVVIDAVSGNNLTLKHTTEAGFTNSNVTLTFGVDENALDGTVIGSVAGMDVEREERITSLLADNSGLRYSSETDKFYQLSADRNSLGIDPRTRATASVLLNGEAAQLVTIRSAYENNLVQELASGELIYIGASDATVDGEWYWQQDSNDADLFWIGTGSGYDVGYANWLAGEPSSGGSQQHARMSSTGLWSDGSGTVAQLAVYEWNADDVLDATNALTYSITSQTVGGAFTIDADSGVITVADGSLLDYETNTAHTLTVQVNDGTNTWDEAFAVSLNNLVEDNNAPTNLSSGIELNIDGGNDAYLVTSNGGAVFGGRTEFTYETQFSAIPDVDYVVLGSYAADDAGGNDFKIFLRQSGDLRRSIAIGG